MDDDASLQTRAAVRPVEPILGLRLLAHPDLERVGALCMLLADQEVSRVAPRFSDGPLATLHVSRTPVALRLHPGGVTLSAPVHAKLTVESKPLVGERTFSDRELDAGVVLTLGRGVALWLGRFEPGAAPQLPGFVGVSAASSALKRQLAELAPRGDHVLLLGGPGAGKRAAAQVLHALGPWSSRPLAQAPSAETAYVPELCSLDAIEQTTVITRLETRPPSGRLIAGCAHQPPSPLRVRFRDVLQLPPLHERPEDVAPLFVHLVREALLRVGALGRFRAVEDQPPFLPAPLVAAVVRAHWVENARQLRAFAEAYVQANHAQPRIDEAPWLAALPAARTRPRLSADSIRVALAATDRDLARAASRLGVSRAGLVQRMRKLGLK